MYKLVRRFHLLNYLLANDGKVIEIFILNPSNSYIPIVYLV